MMRILRGASAVGLALAILAIGPRTVIAAVPEDCMWGAHADSDHPLTAKISETCADPADSHVDDASLIGPATVSFYSGPDTEWTKTVTVPVAGIYHLSVTITFQSMAGPITGTSTCCSVTVYDAAPTDPPAPTAAPTQPATPRPVANPTPRPVSTPKNLTRTPAATAAVSNTPDESPSASASDSLAPSQSTSPPPSPSATPAASASPTDATTQPSAAPLADPAASTNGSGSEIPTGALGVAAALALMFVFVVLLSRRRKRRHGGENASDPGR